ncbi:MAG: hypothetical protein QOD86_958 [Miltoncostaeaceae bacterium]|jgi:succinate-acetate transporter protein|nr:hypothetical protein [Miltoncostaeaceae bacterium]
MRDGDPQVVAAPIFVVGSIALGLQLMGIGVDNLASPGTPVPIIIFATGIMLTLCTAWAAALGQSFVACFCGTFGGFWLSYGFFVFGLQQNWWFAPDGTGIIPVSELADTIAIFVFAWAAFFLFITIASFRLPIIYTAIFGLVVVALVLVGIAYLADPVSDGLLKVAGAVVLAFAALGMSLSLTVMNLSLGGPASPPLGKPIIATPAS